MSASANTQTLYLFVVYNWTLIKPNQMTQGTGNAFLEVKTNESLISIRAIESSLREQYNFQTCVVTNYKYITKEEYLIEMKASQPISN